jgi:cobalamin biosynthesis protein CobT
MDNLKLKTLDGYCGRIARTFARKKGVDVRFEGMAAKTNGSTIWLPANSEEVIKEPEGRARIDGLLDHEWLHIYFDGQDREAGRKTALEYAKAHADKRYRFLTNIFDDIRIENNAPYEGVRENLVRMNEWLVNEVKNTPGSQDDNFLNFGKGIIARAHGWDISWMAPGVHERLDAMGDIVARAVQAKTSDDVDALSRDTLKRLREFEMEQEQEQAGQGQADDQEQDGEPESQGDGEAMPTDDSGDSDGDRGDQGGGEDQGGDGEPQDGQEKGDGNASGDDRGEGDLDEQGSGSQSQDGEGDQDGRQSNDSSDAAADDQGDETETQQRPNSPEKVHGPSYGEDFIPDFGANEELPEDISKEGNEQAIGDLAKQTQKGDRRHIPHPDVLSQDKTVKVSPVGKSTHDQFKNELTGVASALKNKLVTVLFARRASFNQGDKDQGRLDRRALASVKTGNTRVFSQRVEGDSQNVAVSLLIDCSASMYGPRIEMAAKAAHVFGDALQALGVPFNIWGFQTIGYPIDYARNSPYNRFQPYRFVQVKEYNENWKRVNNRLPNLKNFSAGCNDDGGAVRWAARRLLEQTADRHILIVLSDGNPAAECMDWDTMENDLNRAVEEITRAGVEVVGLGIQSGAVRNFYPHCSVIDNLGNLPAEVMRHLKDTMTETKKRRGRAA